jgi:protein O-mannosyl-transferase
MRQRGMIEPKPIRSPACQGSVRLRYAGLILLVLAAYVPVLSAGFIWDDDLHVSNNPVLPRATGLRSIWLEPAATPQYYPLVHTTFWLEYRLWGLHAFGYHLTNVFLHAANVVLLWCVLRRLAVPGAFWAAVLFAVHPVQVESVAWISERKNVLSALFYLLGFLAWLRFWPPEERDPRPAGRWIYYPLTLLLLLAALLSKTVACSLPAVLLLVRWWKHGRIARRDVLLTAPMFLMGLALAANTVLLEKHHVGADGAEWHWSCAARLLIAGRALWFYAAKLVWPAPLTFIYPRWHIDVANVWQWGFPLAVLAVLLGLVGLRRRLGRGPLTAVLFFAGTLLPALGFFNIYPMRFSFVADHFQYLASAGLLALLGAGVHQAWTRWRPTPALLSWSMLAVPVALLGALTWRQTGVYHDVLTLWNDTLAKNPDCWMAYHNRGMANLQRGQAQEALADYTRAIELNPALTDAASGLVGAYVMRGNAYRQLGQIQQAINDHSRALELQPDFAGAYSSRGLDYQQLGQRHLAVDDYSRAIALKPDAGAAYMNRGSAYQQLGQMQLAIQDLTRAIELNADLGGRHGLAGAYADRGMAYQQLGQARQAIGDLTRAIEIKPDMAEAYTCRGLAYQQLCQTEQAIRDHSRALQINPDLAEAYANRGSAHQQLGETQRALADFTRALELKPDSADAYYNRGNLYQQLGQAQQAIEDCTRAIDLKPDLALAYGTRALVYHQLGQFEQAIRDYSRALELKPDYLGAYNNRALAYQQAGRLQHDPRPQER